MCNKCQMLKKHNLSLKREDEEKIFLWMYGWGVEKVKGGGDMNEEF